MGLEANVVYLEEEIANLKERIEAIQNFLLANPSVSIYRRSIKGRIYYYKKYRQGSKSISKFLGSGNLNIMKISKEINSENRKIKKAKMQLAILKYQMVALNKQARIARKALENARA